MAFGANLMKKCSKLDEEGNNKWLQICPCVIYAVGEIRGINCSLGQHHHRIRHHLPRGTGQCDSPDCLTVSQSGLSVCLSDCVTDKLQTLLSVSLSLKGDAVFTSWLHQQAGKELGKSSWSIKPSYKHIHQQTHKKNSTLYVIRHDICRLHWGC